MKKGNLLNEPIDISEDFYHPDNEYYLPGAVKQFNAATGEGLIQWNYHRWVTDWSFNKMGRHLKQLEEREIFWKEHDTHPVFSFSLSFISQRTIRLRIKTTAIPQVEDPSLILDGEPATDANNWQTTDSPEKTTYKSEYGSVVLSKKNWQLELYDSGGQLLTSTLGMDVLTAMHHKTIPSGFIKRASDYTRSAAACFSLFPGEKIYGCGESFTALNKRGQKVVLCTTDAQSTATGSMYKPIPFFISSRGHGLFLHTSTPVTMDFGNRFDGSKIVYCGEDQLDLFLFIGSPKEILSEYTALTGRSPLPPLWSFGLWMSRFTYRSQEEVTSIAVKLREHQIPCDVIHIDAGWFKNGINCDYEFCNDHFPDPGNMMGYLRDNGFKTSLWQLPYYSEANPVFAELVAKKLVVRDGNGNVATDEAVLDFSNSNAQAWYTKKIKALLHMGAAVIKADFGEAAPYNGYYASGRSGFFEHNLYPLRYTRLLHDITKTATGEDIIWARSAWAGSQRYPIHWGGDPEVSDTGMACTLRAGLSLGLSGFSFWGHDIGGFLSSPREELFTRWAVFGLFTSHSRVHGIPPREPWEFSDDFIRVFRKVTEMKYRLMPYVYTQAAISAQNGWPLLKALLLNYPGDPTAWLIEDEYLFGDDMLVAPLLEEHTTGRLVYLPEGKWIDYQTHTIYEGRQWHAITAGEVPGIILVKYGSLIPHIPLAQSTAFMDWTTIDLVAFAEAGTAVSGKYYAQKTRELVELHAGPATGGWKLTADFPNANYRLHSYNQAL